MTHTVPTPAVDMTDDSNTRVSRCGVFYGFSRWDPEYLAADCTYRFRGHTVVPRHQGTAGHASQRHYATHRMKSSRYDRRAVINF